MSKRYISADSDTGAPSGEKTSLAGTEYVPLSGNQVTKISTIRNFVSVPANASATGTAGQMSYDSDFLYICTSTNTWKKVGIATW